MNEEWRVWGGEGWGKLYYYNMVMIFIDDNDNVYNQDIMQSYIW
jgi:hypothetical protein